MDEIRKFSSETRKALEKEGYIIYEERNNLGKIEIKTTDYGKENRSFDWQIEQSN